MSPIQKNFAASGILVLLFFGASRHLAKEKAVLESRVEAIRQSSLALESGRSRSRPPRERTVGDLLREYGGPMSAKELLQAWSYSANQGAMEKWKIDVFYLSQLSLDELLELEIALRNEDGPGEARQSLLRSVSARVYQYLKNDRNRYFDHVVRIGDCSLTTKIYFSEWVEEEPKAAIEWFRSLEPGDEEDSPARPKANVRDEFRSLLLDLLTNTDLETAIILLKEENARGTPFEIPRKFCRDLVERAVESGDDSLIVEMLKSNRISHLPLFHSDIDPFSDFDHFWGLFTKATGDLDRSVDLLQSFDKPHGYGEAMAQIISSEAELPLREQIDWLGARIEDQGDLDRGVTSLLDQRFGFEPFSADGPLPQEAQDWLDVQLGTPSGEPFLSSLAASYSLTGEHVRAWEIARRLSVTEANESQLLEYGRLLYDGNRAEAIRVLPPELVEQFEQAE